jgi:hypothetical protein
MKIQNLRLRASGSVACRRAKIMGVAAVLPLLMCGCPNARVNPNWPILHPTISSGNLLSNPDASGSSVTPPWNQSLTIGTGSPNTSSTTWTKHLGAVSSGSVTINTADGSPWFYNDMPLSTNGAVGVNCGISSASGGGCSEHATVTISQTVSVATFIAQHRSISVIYGGDAFALGGAAQFSGTVVGWRAQGMEKAYFAVKFEDSGGQPLTTDSSADVLGSSYSCSGPSGSKSNYGFRKTVTPPSGTASIVFTATMEDHLAACSASPSHTFAYYKNGFDNLWLEIQGQ